MDSHAVSRDGTRRAADSMALAAAIIFPSFATWLYFDYLGGSPASQSAYAICKVAQFAFPLIWIYAVQRNSFARIPRPHTRDLLLGAAFGLAVVAVGLGIYYGYLRGGSLLSGAQRALSSKLSGFGIRGKAQYFALAAFYSLAHSLLEEYYWRWFVFGQLRRYIPLAAAIGVSSLGFAAHHVLLLANFLHGYGPMTWLLASAIAVGGAVWAWQYQRDGTLYGAWLGHAVIDAGLMWIGWDVWQAGGWR